MLSTRLRQATRALHAQAENANFGGDIRARTLRPAQYALLLQRQYWLHKNVEERCGTLQLDRQYTALALSRRDKRPLLEQDLKQLGAWPPPAARASFPTLDDQQLLGALYVAEGATLGGRVIRSMLAANPYMANIQAFGFFEVYGTATKEHWQNLIDTLDGRATDRGVDENKVIAGAVQTFEYFVALSQP